MWRGGGTAVCAHTAERVLRTLAGKLLVRLTGMLFARDGARSEEPRPSGFEPLGEPGPCWEGPGEACGVARISERLQMRGPSDV